MYFNIRKQLILYFVLLVYFHNFIEIFYYHNLDIKKFFYIHLGFYSMPYIYHIYIVLFICDRYNFNFEYVLQFILINNII